MFFVCYFFFFFKQKTAYEMRISDWSSDVCSSDLFAAQALGRIKFKEAVTPLLTMLEKNDDKDLYLRYAGVLALSRIGDVAPIIALVGNPKIGRASCRARVCQYV